MAWNPAFRLIRPDDQVILDVRISGPEPKKVTSTTPGGPTHHFELTGPREIWVQFGPQQIVEYAKPEGGVRVDQADPLFVPRTDLVFTVTSADPAIPATVPGLLAALTRLPLKTANTDPLVQSPPARRRSRLDPHQLVAAVADRTSALTDAAPGGEFDAERRAAAAERVADAVARRHWPRAASVVIEPERTESESTESESTESEPIERPAQPARAGGDAVAAPIAQLGGPIGTQPATSLVAMPRRLAVRPPRGPVRMSHSPGQVTHDGRTELWHTRLAVTTAGPAGTPVEIELPVALTALPRTAALSGPRDENTIRNALFDIDAVNVANQIKPPFTNQDGSPSSTAAARLGRLMLSALGGWLRLAGNWPSGVRELRLDTAQGRDQLQRKVVTGRLMPFGHKALLTSTTIRHFESGATRAAGLETRSVLQVITPIVGSDPVNGVQRRWPFSSVEILHRDPIVGAEGFLPEFNVSTFDVDGLPFRFRCTALDRSGEPIDFAIPMVFARDGVTDAVAFAGWKNYTGVDQPPPAAGADESRKTEYFLLDLAGQRVGVAVPPPDNPALSSEEPISEKATTVLARQLQLGLDAANRPVMKQLKARVEALERFAPGTGEVSVEYAKPYLDSLLQGANAQGQVFLEFAKNSGSALAQPLVGIAGRATAGMAQLNLPIAALSRRFGAVAGELPGGPVGSAAAQQTASTIAALAAGDLDLRFLTSTLGSLSSKLLGLVDLGDLIPLNPKPKLADTQRITTDVLNGVTRQTLTWNVPLLERTGVAPSIKVTPFRQGFISIEGAEQIPQPADPKLVQPILTIVQQTEADPVKLEMRSTTTCTITGLVLRVYMSDDVGDEDNVPIVSIPFKKISFVTKDGGKPDFDVVLGKVEFGGILQFVRILADLIDQLGLSDPPALEVTTTGVRSSFSFDVPAVAIGMFALQNIAFSTALDLTFQPDETHPALLLTVGFASRANPFLLTVSFLGGGGYLEIAAASDGLARIEGSLQFGAALVIKFGFVAKGSVEAMGGVIFLYDRPKKITRLTAFLQVRGELSVLSLITLSVTLLLELSYDFRREILSGHAEVVVEVSVWFFSQSVCIPYDWEAKTGNNDPTFAELMAPAGISGEKPWDTYCMAFAA